MEMDHMRSWVVVVMRGRERGGGERGCGEWGCDERGGGSSRR